MRTKAPPTKVARLLRGLPLILLLAACATGSIRERILTVPVMPGATYVAQETCSGCHEELAANFTQSTHGRLASFELLGAEGGCQSCHGPGSLHAESGAADKIFRFSTLTADETAALCSRCHSAGKLIDWAHSGHALGDVACNDCHRFHGEGIAAKAALKQAEPELCYGCHQEQQAKAGLPSHHPVKEGKMTCSDCHNAHGELQTEEQANDLCFNCHSRYQGPFVFEHAPVQEDCGICHDPHGSVANNLLKQNEPFLCLQCHESHFHTMRIGSTTTTGLSGLAFDANQLGDTPPAPADGTVKPTVDTGVAFGNSHGADGWRMGFGTKCTVCHSQQHGSDLPSQTSPTIGNNGEGWPDGAKGLTR